MEPLQAIGFTCPYCGEMIELTVDCSLAAQEYIEDCRVCCRPIEIAVFMGPGGRFDLRAAREDDA